MSSLKQKLNADFAHTTGSSDLKSFIILFLKRKSVRIVVVFRILNHYYYSKNIVAKFFLLPLSLYYRLMTNRYCVDLPVNTKIGPGLKLNHAYCLVVNFRATIGSNVYLGHNVTIGSVDKTKVPKIGNNVTIFPGSILIGDITVGDNVIIGAGSLVVKDVPPNTVVGGHPCKILKSSVGDV